MNIKSKAPMWAIIAISPGGIPTLVSYDGDPDRRCDGSAGTLEDGHLSGKQAWVQEIKMVGTDGPEDLGFYGILPEEPGIWVWEGAFCYSEWDGEVDLDVRGKFRKAAASDLGNLLE